VFGLSLVDHLRLTFGHVIYSHKAHTLAAERHARWDRWLKAGEALLMLATALNAVALAFTLNPMHAWAAAGTATVALCILIARLTTTLDRSSSTHHACGAQLWHIREQYRALLSDLRDGVLTPDAARERRDGLMFELHRIYEDAPLPERARYRSARETLGPIKEAALTDEEIDQFLPGSLQKAANS
jgi:hypothetical protein